MKLSEYTNEDALEVLADILEPASMIITDEQFKKSFETDPVFKCASYLLKAHKKEIISILAIIKGVPVKEYRANIFTMTKDVVELLSDKELMDFLSELGIQTDSMSFGVPMANTGEEGK